MRSFLVRGGIAVVLLAILWFLTSRWCALLVDQFYTRRLATLQSTPLGWNGVWLQFGSGISNMIGPMGWSGPELTKGGHIVDFTGPGPDDKQVATLKIAAGDQLVLLKNGTSFVLGSRAGTLHGGGDEIPAFAADPGDTTSVTLECSVLNWPASLQINLGRSAS